MLREVPRMGKSAERPPRSLQDRGPRRRPPIERHATSPIFRFPAGIVAPADPQPAPAKPNSFSLVSCPMAELKIEVLQSDSTFLARTLRAGLGRQTIITP